MVLRFREEIPIEIRNNLAPIEADIIAEQKRSFASESEIIFKY